MSSIGTDKNSEKLILIFILFVLENILEENPLATQRK